MNITPLNETQEMFIDAPTFEQYVYRQCSTMEWVEYKRLLVKRAEMGIELSVLDNKTEQEQIKYLLSILDDTQKRIEEVYEKHKVNFAIYQARKCRAIIQYSQISMFQGVANNLKVENSPE